MDKMRIALLLTVLLALAFSVVGQAPAKDAPVKWEALNGKNKEFVVFMPAGYQSASRGTYYPGRSSSGTAKVSLHNTLYRYINGVVLIMEYFEGKAKPIQDHFIEREKLTDVAAETFGDFAVKRFSEVRGKQIIKINHFALEDRLYVIKSYSDTDNNPISTGFFQSVRLNLATGRTAPNAPPGTKETALPNLIEMLASADDTQVLLSKDVDRDAIVIYTPRPSFSFRERQGLGEASVKLKLLLSATGKVTDVKVVSSSTKVVEQAAIEAAKKTIFVPAQKDGRLVATYKTTEYMMVSVR